MKGENEQLAFFVYCRKSSEDDRQAASIGDQLRELSALVARERLSLVGEPLTEEKSAKEPGRPVFSQMLDRVERGEANAILCWDIDRLYRNPVDEGRVRWLLQRGIVRQIRTPFRTFYPQDAGLLMGVEGGRATDHIITLRKGVFRGFRGKLEKGQRPGVAPPGYLNNRANEKGERDITPDPDRFQLIRRAWDLMLTGQYSVRQIQKLAAEQWGLRSRKSKKLGGKPYAISTWYRIFTDPFYCGLFWWKTPETNNRALYRGSHVPMISRAEFDQVQLLLGWKGKPVPKAHRFPFTGLIRCGECGAMVTAEEKHQIICGSCRLKFSAPNKDACPRCGLEIEKMPTATRLHYTYYHCTKRKAPTCRQRSLRAEELDRQIDAILTSTQISEEFKDWAIEALHAESQNEAATQRAATDSVAKRQTEIRRQLEHMNEIILSPETDWTLISSDEIKAKKTQLMEELRSIEERAARSPESVRDSLELTAQTFEFGAYARFWFREGDLEQRRAILAALGSNLTLKDKKLALELQEPLRELQAMIRAVPPISGAFEPANRRFTKRESPPFGAGTLCLRRGRNAIRTLTRSLQKLRTWFRRNPAGWNPPLLAQFTKDTDGDKAVKVAALNKNYQGFATRRSWRVRSPQRRRRELPQA